MPSHHIISWMREMKPKRTKKEIIETTHRICPDCGLEKSLMDFHKDRRSPDGHAYYCKPCMVKRVMEWQKEHPRPKLAGLLRLRKRLERPRKALPHIRITRKDVLNYLGNKCAVCGFSDPRALQIDHINNDGKIHRAKFPYKIRLYEDILESLKRGEKKYQILCANCNTIKEREREKNRSFPSL